MNKFPIRMKKRFKKVLVAVDGSEQSFETVRYVASLMPAEQTKLFLCHVMSRIPDNLWDLYDDPDLRFKLLHFPAWKSEQTKTIETFMDKASIFLEKSGYPSSHVYTLVRDRKSGIARDIMKEASKGYDALVVGRRGTNPSRDLILGSTASKLVEGLAHLPVWVVGGRPNPDKILVAMDSSDSAIGTLEYVGKLLEKPRKELLLYHAIRGLPLSYASEGSSPRSRKLRDLLATFRGEIESEKELMQSFFARRIRALEEKGMDVSQISTKIVTGVSSRAGSVVEEARKGDFGTIVIGRRGLSKVREFVMGRVSSKVLQMARDMAVWVVN